MIVIPMAGLSSRFSKAGYDLPKYMLPLKGHTVFDYSVASFRSVFNAEPFLFIGLARDGMREFISDHASALGIGEFNIVILDQPTAGQAETVVRGISAVNCSNSEPITIFNIDTFNVGGYSPILQSFPKAAGVLEVFRGDGDNWSFVAPDPQDTSAVARTTEKIPISDLCSTGLYYFKSFEHLKFAYDSELNSPQAAELYVAPLYNHLIQRGMDVRYYVVERKDIIFCGVPSEYEGLRQNDKSLPALSLHPG